MFFFLLSAKMILDFRFWILDLRKSKITYQNRDSLFAEKFTGILIVPFFL